MKGENNQNDKWKQELCMGTFGRRGKARHVIFPQFRAFYDDRTGEVSAEIHIPQFSSICFPDDLRVVMQTVGWGISSLHVRSQRVLIEGLYPWIADRKLEELDDVWQSCCCIMGEFEARYRLE